MNAIDRAYRNFEILLARAAGATAPELSERFGLEERQIRRILKEVRATRRGQDIEAAHQLAESRLQELYRVIEVQGRALDQISNPFMCIALSDTMLAYFREIREVEELLGRFPREIDWKFKGSDAGWLWQRFRSVIQRHPGAWDEFHDDLYSAYAGWLQGQLQRQGNRGHKSLGKMSGFRAKTRPPATIQPSQLEEMFLDALIRDVEKQEGHIARTSTNTASGDANPGVEPLAGAFGPGSGERDLGRRQLPVKRATETGQGHLHRPTDDGRP